MSAGTTIRVILAALLAAGGAAFAANAQSVGLQPSSVEMELAPGARTRQVVTLSNRDMARPVSVSLSLADWTHDETGSVVFSPSGVMDRSAAQWARLGPGTISLAPGQTKQVAVDLALPEDLKRAGDFRVALVASTVAKTTAGGWEKRSVASLISLAAGKAVSRPKITGSRLTVDQAGREVVQLDLYNPGNAHARLGGTVEITGRDAYAATIPVRDLVLLEGARRTLNVPLEEALPPDADIEVHFENLFAPQKPDETDTLPVHRVETEIEVSSLAPPLGGQD